MHACARARRSQDERRLNVAITRARHALWLVASSATLSRKSEVRITRTSVIR